MTELEALEVAGRALAASRGVTNPLAEVAANLDAHLARLEDVVPDWFGIPPIEIPGGASSVSAQRAYEGINEPSIRTAAVLDAVTGLGVDVPHVRDPAYRLVGPGA